MRMLIWVVIFGLWAAGCQKLPQKATNIHTDSVSLSHDASVEIAPTADVDNSQEKLEVPPEATIKVVKVEATPATDKNPFEPAKTEMVVVLPKNKGATFYKTDTKTKLTGSKGFAPEKGPTPTEKANAWWTKIGVVIFAVGLFFCTPWGGSNYRVGAIIAAGGVGMAVIGKFIDQIRLPAPAIFSISIVIALAVYYGYRVRHKQIETSTQE